MRWNVVILVQKLFILRYYSSFVERCSNRWWPLAFAEDQSRVNLSYMTYNYLYTIITKIWQKSFTLPALLGNRSFYSGLFLAKKNVLFFAYTVQMAKLLLLLLLNVGIADGGFLETAALKDIITWFSFSIFFTGRTRITPPMYPLNNFRIGFIIHRYTGVFKDIPRYWNPPDPSDSTRFHTQLNLIPRGIMPCGIRSLDVWDPDGVKNNI